MKEGVEKRAHEQDQRQDPDSLQQLPRPRRRNLGDAAPGTDKPKALRKVDEGQKTEHGAEPKQA